MSHQDTWLEHDLGLYRRYVNDISMVDILEANLETQVDPRFDCLSYIINDFTAITGLTLDTESTQEIADIDIVRSSTKTPLQLAVVTTTDPEHMALAQGYCLQMEACHYKCQAFTCLSEARTWVQKKVLTTS